MAAGTAAAALLPVVLLNGGPAAAGPKPPSWAMPPLAARAARGGSWSWVTEASGGPAALIYVDRECPHCKAELRRWEMLAREFDFVSRVWVIASPESEMNEAHWVSPSLRGRTVQDFDGSVRALLGVNAVPATFWVDATDTVRIVQIGQSSKQRLIDNILTINLVQDNE